MKFDLNRTGWDTATKISFLQRRVIVACIAYYELNETLISDADYTELAEQLIEEQAAHPEDAEKSAYYYAMKGFEVSTGYDAFEKLTDADKDWLVKIARRALAAYATGRTNT